MPTVVPDYETASACDLAKAGSRRYSEDPTTEILCLSLRWAEDDVILWYPGDPIPTRWIDAIADGKSAFVAHNAGFEQDIYEQIQVPQWGWPEIPLNRWHCSQARCAQLCLPQKLEKAVPLLGLPGDKDMEGNKLTLSLSKVITRGPEKGNYPARTPEILQRVGEYCNTDTLEQLRLHNRIGWLSDGERANYLLNQRVNKRGVRLDMPLVGQMQKVVAGASVPLAAEFAELTGGLKMTQVQKVQSWVMDRGVWLPNMAKDTLEPLVGDSVDDDGEEIERAEGIELPADVERALRIRYLIGSASVKKLDRMQACVCADGRVRRITQYYGAGTGREAGRLFQPQNFPRGSIHMERIDLLVDALMTGDWQYVEMMCGPAVETVVSALRHIIVAAPGNTLVAGDFAQIEARIILALAGQHDKVALLASGADPYIDMAQQIYKRTITKKDDPEERQVGKNSVLGLGFQMGAQTFMNRYGNGQDLAFFKEVVRVYREEWAPCVPEVWYALEEAACRTVWDRTPHEAYGIRFELVDLWLKATLPSGGTLWYFNPRPCRKAMPWDDTDVRAAWTCQMSKGGRTITVDMYGGILTENAVQRMARDLLYAAMHRLERENLAVCLSVHDEALSEAPYTNDLQARVDQIMSDTPAWGLEMKIPVATEVWVGERYRK